MPETRESEKEGTSQPMPASEAAPNLKEQSQVSSESKPEENGQVTVVSLEPKTSEIAARRAKRDPSPENSAASQSSKDRSTGKKKRKAAKPAVPRRCENPNCDNVTPYPHKGPDGLKICPACYMWAKSHNANLRPRDVVEKSNIRAMLFQGTRICGNPVCHSLQSKHWFADIEGRRLLCDICARRARVEKHKNALCENPACREVVKELKKGPNGMKICQNCYNWFRYHGGALREKKDVEMSRLRSGVMPHVCSQCQCTQSGTWLVDYKKAEILCEDCANKMAPSKECQNPNCKEKVRYLQPLGDKGQLVCGKCYNWGRKHDSQLRGKEEVQKTQLNGDMEAGNYICSVCRGRDSREWSVDREQGLLICYQCQQVARAKEADKLKAVDKSKESETLKETLHD